MLCYALAHCSSDRRLTWHVARCGTLVQVLYYRDCRTINKIQVAVVTEATGVAVSEPFALETKWDFEAFVRTKAGSDTGGSW